ncbi:hypothetical protein VAE308_1150262 [Vibrio aestuarianus]|uniref:Uncharacterized protein n=1 Tax=Vibrio aestuarianus TaxID=28171 RepID=A0ABM9FI30_9VIBR|nr:hypothetical protein VAE063_1000313 [Vibrio aestuarianus]CAH8218483.1 hypothetical protein VAE308_1150262 [Vibrio aestuarianus]CAH8223719.1 hypothetical protein VAE115_370314 [Vibrio aestuarianus]CAH8233670.1 hypothetical protein VAE016_410317 [Vibrio aestuarianus]CAH8237415.1 hypothetical protein VAEKB19_5200042 [Vibrio aestuarianus]
MPLSVFINCHSKEGAALAVIEKSTHTNDIHFVIRLSLFG